MLHPDLAFSLVKQRQHELVDRWERRHLLRRSVPRCGERRLPDALMPKGELP
ncbi:MAG TPA: hypothetical protein VME46_21745 [Acidimicrobiales bacterium]|nr:hypothetical protein [Acidimicrobiales bacterium]